ncbi:Lrp/AsnC family transcriptional regulator [Candidatus Woesearchaeota archaeon]|nr:Lrp/AsnC family transcriptional regulator [Candidatus Woesearchaeota archaeon]
MYDLDTLNKKIIFLLDFDARMPISKLAKKLHISKQRCVYRLKKLEHDGVIQGYYADVNASKLGFSIYLVYFQFHHFSPKLEHEFILHVSKQERVHVNVSVNGSWDHCIGILAESVVHFKKHYQDLMKGYEQYIKKKAVMIETDFFYFKPKQILNQSSENQITMTGEIERCYIDEKDQIILSAIAKDSRTSLVNLGKIVGLTPNAAKQRIRNLEKKKIILGYRIMINYPLLNFLHYRVFLHFGNSEEKNEKKIIQFLKYAKTCVSVTKTIGYCGMEFRAIVRDIHEFYELMERLRNEFPETIQDYESILYYKFHKVLNYFPISCKKQGR